MPEKRTYGQACPIAHSLDLVGERWALLVVRELRLGPRRYGDLQAALPGIGPSVLSQRLRDLEAVGILRKRGKEYGLTEWGAELDPVFRALAHWGVRSPVVPLEGAVGTDSMFLGLRTFFGSRDPQWTGSYEFRLDRDVYRVEVREGELVSLWRGRSGEPAAVVVETDDATMGELFGGALTLAGAVESERAAVAGDVSDAQRLLDASPLSAVR
ncbi:winged helix-turn-helix transcriptional regulator [Phytomonospora sp. NPDC050363]|uniref:winged helix-turn-helix transcriptional regulator n=1 Tax=Phytomonospora sp. NPDC050363 TaxID=3155642 RepID=UPI0033DF00D5